LLFRSGDSTFHGEPQNYNFPIPASHKQFWHATLFRRTGTHRCRTLSPAGVAAVTRRFINPEVSRSSLNRLLQREGPGVSRAAPTAPRGRKKQTERDTYRVNE
jgi:hypothetical protein